MSRWLVGLTVLALLVGATSIAAPVPVHLMPKEPPLYFPTRVGAKWVYQVNRKGCPGDMEETQSVSAIERTNAGTIVTITNHRPNGKTFLDKKVLVTLGGVTDIETSDGKLESPWCWLKIPGVVGEKWESDCSNDIFVQKWKCETIGTEEVKVPAGTFVAVKVRSVLLVEPRGGGPFPNLNISHINWYAPGVGVVKVERSGIASDWVLKSFTP